MINEKELWQGTFEIKIKNKETGEVKQEILHNRIMNVGLQEIVKPLYGGTANITIKYLALGTGTTAITDNDAALATESIRMSADSTISATATGQVTSEFVLTETAMITAIQEIGIFCGTSASMTANVGIMLSRILWYHDHTNTEEITFRRIDQISRG